MRTSLLSCSVAAAIAMGGCDFETEPTQVPAYPAASHVVINEVYTLPPEHPNRHSWVELYNSSRDTVDITGWTLTVTVAQRQLVTLNYPDSSGNDTLEILYAFDSTFAPADVPVAPFHEHPVLKPGYFHLFVTDLQKMYLYFNLGAGPGLEPESMPFYTERVRRRGTGGVDTVVTSLVDVYLPQTDQLILKDSAGAVVDVVRYGNYIAPGTDPFPSNRSFGVIPEYESIARFAGGYATGSTADDFYVTHGRTLPPIPLYHSMLRKQ